MRRTLRLGLAIGLLMLGSSCDDWSFDELDRDHDLTVRNQSVCDLLVHLDGVRVLELPAESEDLIQGLEPGLRELVAYLDEGGVEGAVVSKIEIDVSGYEDYRWIISDCGQEGTGGED